MKHVLLAEGPSEEGLVKALLRESGHDPNSISITCLKGIGNLASVLKAKTTEPEWRDLDSVTIIVDADNDPIARRERVWQLLGQHASLLDATVQIGRARGSAIEHGARYAVWISPGSDEPGRIEDLVCRTIEPEVRRCIRDLWTCARGAVGTPEPSSKAEAAVWIALREDEGLGLRIAFERGVVNVRNNAFAPLRDLIRGQFDHRRG